MDSETAVTSRAAVANARPRRRPGRAPAELPAGRLRHRARPHPPRGLCSGTARRGPRPAELRAPWQPAPPAACRALGPCLSRRRRQRPVSLPPCRAGRRRGRLDRRQPRATPATERQGRPRDPLQAGGRGGQACRARASRKAVAPWLPTRTGARASYSSTGGRSSCRLGGRSDSWCPTTEQGRPR
jgi:hypothetical protein